MPNLNLRPSSLSVGGQSIHYAWVIVLVAAVMRLSTSGFRSSSSILVPRIVEAFGWSYGAVGIGFSLQWIVSGLFGPPSGWLGDRYGRPRDHAPGWHPVHRWHGADREDGPSVAVLPVLWRRRQHFHGHLPGAFNGGRNPLVPTKIRFRHGPAAVVPRCGTLGCRSHNGAYLQPVGTGLGFHFARHWRGFVAAAADPVFLQ